MGEIVWIEQIRIEFLYSNRFLSYGRKGIVDIAGKGNGWYSRKETGGKLVIYSEELIAYEFRYIISY